MAQGTSQGTTHSSALVDTHCHLDAGAFADESVDAVLARATAVGVTGIVTIGTDIEASRRALGLAQAYPSVWAAVGVDPNDLDGYDDATLDALRDLAASDAVVAIGEIGLDYYWNRFPHDQQRRAFRAQLDLAAELDLPVVIHDRDAHEDVEAVLTAWAAECGGRRPLGVMHCFSGDLGMAESLVDLGFLISLAGNVTYRNASNLHELAARLPADTLVLETDAPFLSPQPRRGSRNEPAHVRLIAEHVAGLRGVSVDEIAQATTANAERLFGLRLAA